MPGRHEPDASLRRIERDSAVIAGAAALAALVILRGRLDGALGVLGGGALMAFGYRAIKSGVDAIVTRAAPGPDAAGREPSRAARRAMVWTLAKLIGRYAVMAVVAWIVLVPLGAHPLGVVAGVTTPVLAIAIEGVRLSRRASSPRRPAPPPDGAAGS